MDCKYCSPCWGTLNIDTPFVAQSSEAQLRHSLVERQVPYAAGLFHAIEAFCQAPDPVLFSWLLEARGLFHRNSFRFRENPMEESCLDVDMLNVMHRLCIGCVLESTLITRVTKDFMAKLTRSGVRSGSRLAN